MTHFIVLRSSTAAFKAQSVLRGFKIKSEVDKIAAKGGCRFGIRVEGDADKICRMLALSSIECIEIIKDGGVT